MAAQRSHVPKFGNWESEDNVPYTAYFDKARKGRPGTRMVNPNDPEENSDLVLDNSSAELPPSKPRLHSEDPSGKGSVSSTDELQKSKEDADPKHFINSPARHDTVGNKSAGDRDSAHYHGGYGVNSPDTRSRRPSRQSTGSEYGIDRSPLHRQARTPGRDSLEGKNSYDNSHGTPGRSRLRPVNRGDETPDKEQLFRSLVSGM